MGKELKDKIEGLVIREGWNPAKGTDKLTSLHLVNPR
jgi:hypothetical protein